MCVFVKKLLLIVLDSAPWLDDFVIGYVLLCPPWMTSAALTGTSCTSGGPDDGFLPGLGLLAPG